MQACVKAGAVGANVKQIVFQSECIKYEIVRIPAQKNLFLSYLFNKKKLTANTVNHHIIRGNYSIVSGLFCSTFLRQFSTGQARNLKREDGILTLKWAQTPKPNTNENFSKQLTGQVLGDVVFKNVIDPHIIKRKLPIYAKSNSQNRSANSAEKISLLSASDKSLSLSKTSVNPISILRRYHSCRTVSLILSDGAYNLPSITFKSSSLILYKPPESKVSIVVKYYHDWKTPDFTYYRLSQTARPNVNSTNSIAERKLPTVLVYTAFGLAGAYSIKSHGTHYIMYLSASAEVLALAKVEIKLSDIVEGRSVTFKWRGKPLFIRHRTAQQIETERSVDIATLRDPQRDEDRCQDPKWLIVIGVCTHLGCVPIANVGDFPGGYYCPCHGSHFDGSGRARKGPAPLNLEVPQYKFEGDLVIVG